MTGDVTVLCRPLAAAGFALAGLAPVEVTDPTQAGDRLAALLARTDVGVVLVEDELWTRLPEDVRRQAERGTRPVVVPFPSPQRPAGMPAHEHLVQILQRAIGYRVQL